VDAVDRTDDGAITSGDGRRLRVGFVGLGVQGLPMAVRIARAGWPLRVWARRPNVTAPAEALGAGVAGSMHDLAGTSELLGICVTTDDDVVEVVEAAYDGLCAGAIVVIHSTVLPETCAAVAARVAAQGAHVVDAPVSGGRTGAEAGTLAVMVGGDAATVERARPVFDSFGVTYHLGALGSGQRMKLLNNAMLAAHLRLAYDAVDLAGDLDLDLATAQEVLLNGSGGSAAMRSMLRFRTLDPAKVAANMAKDVDHFRAVVSGSIHADRVNRLAGELVAHLSAGRRA
jgi:3-hydroxyisobutyrate dehydrogenase-like beta-hydroxyacid dehydrogenase